jgi:hypothetical protein
MKSPPEGAPLQESSGAVQVSFPTVTVTATGASVNNDLSLYATPEEVIRILRLSLPRPWSPVLQRSRKSTNRSSYSQAERRESCLSHSSLALPTRDQARQPSINSRGGTCDRGPGSGGEKVKLLTIQEAAEILLELNPERYDPEGYEWEEEVASDDQIQALERFGICVDEDLTKRLASYLIGTLVERAESGRCTLHQAQILHQLGVKNASAWNARDAHAEIERRSPKTVR